MQCGASRPLVWRGLAPPCSTWACRIRGGLPRPCCVCLLPQAAPLQQAGDHIGCHAGCPHGPVPQLCYLGHEQVQQLLQRVLSAVRGLLLPLLRLLLDGFSTRGLLLLRVLVVLPLLASWPPLLQGLLLLLRKALVVLPCLVPRQLLQGLLLRRLALQPSHHSGHLVQRPQQPLPGTRCVLQPLLCCQVSPHCCGLGVIGCGGRSQQRGFQRAPRRCVPPPAMWKGMGALAVGCAAAEIEQGKWQWAGETASDQSWSTHLASSRSPCTAASTTRKTP